MLNPADAPFAERLAGALPKGTIRQTAPADIEEPRGKWHGQEGFVAMPATTEEAAIIIRACNDARVGVLPRAGGTGLVAGQVATNGPAPLIVSLEKMTAIRAIYPGENTLVAEAGVTLADLHKAADDVNRLFPLSYASKDTARIGGGLSVNSGGLNVLRYGMARDLCLGIEAVLPNGDILHGLKRLRKDNTGYDLRHLLIGAEGTLGLITAAALKLMPKPREGATAVFQVTSPAAALDLLALLRDLAGDTVSAFELIAGEGLRMLAETYPDTRQHFDTPPDWSVLTDLAMPEGSDPHETFAKAFEQALERDLVTDARIASSGAQAAEMWNVREMIPAANSRIGALASHDIALPLSEIPDFIRETTPRAEALGPLRINCFGHLGDGNLHYNAFPLPGSKVSDHPGLGEQVSRLVHDEAMARGGTFSAEHGIGRFKVDELNRYGDPAKLAAMRAIKTALDPNGIMNPGAVLAH